MGAGVGIRRPEALVVRNVVPSKANSCSRGQERGQEQDGQDWAWL
jgi:hypothetical protein